MGLNITNGQCVNSSVPNNVTFGEQGGPLGNAALRLTASITPLWGMFAAGLVALAFTIV